MSELYSKAFIFTMANEGGFSDHRRDKGGATLYGVSSKYFPAVFESLQNAKDEVEIHDILYKFYYNHFWNPLYEQIYDSKLAIRLFDLSVNIGMKPSVKLLQNASNVLGSRLILDGNFGKGTLAAVNVTKPYNEYVREVENYYRSLSDFDVFGRGWINRLKKEII